MPRLTADEAHAIATAPIRLWRGSTGFGCNVIHPVKRWAGVQVGLMYHSGGVTGGRKVQPKSVYYDADRDAYTRAEVE